MAKNSGRKGKARSRVRPKPPAPKDTVVPAGADDDALKQTRAELFEHERRLSTLFSNLPGMAYSCRNDSVWTMTIVSDGCKAVTGYERSELLQNHTVAYGDLLHPEDRDILWSKCQASLDARTPCTNEYRIIVKSGEIRWVSERAEGVYDDDGTLLHIEGFVQDITDRKRAEESLAASEARYRTIVEAAHEGIWLLDSQACTTFANRRMGEMLGYAPEEMVGRNLMDFMDEEGRQQAMANLERRADGIAEDHEFRFVRRDGSDLWATCSTSPLHDDQGEYIGALGLIMDITERRRSERALEEREAQLREAQRIAGTGSWEWTVGGDPIAWSEGMDLILGRDVGLGPPTFATLPQCYTPESWERLGPAIARAIEQGAPYELELEMIRADGTICWTTTRGEAVRGPDGAVVSLRGTVHDISRRRRVEEELRHQTAVLEAQANSTIDGILVVDREGKKTFQNHRTVELWKIPSDIAEDSDDAAQVQHVMRSTTNPQQFVERVNYLYSHPEETSRGEIELLDGTTLDVYSAPVLGKQGQNYGRIWTFHDITERRRSERALEEREAQLREAQRIAGTGSWEWTVGGDPIAWSEGMDLILGRDVGLGPPTFATLPQCYTPESWERLGPAIARAIEQGASYELELEMIRPTARSAGRRRAGKRCGGRMARWRVCAGRCMTSPSASRPKN